MPFLTDEEIQEKLESPENLKNRLEIHKIERGRKEGSLEIPMEEKKAIATLALSGDLMHKDIAELFDIGKTEVGIYASGRTRYCSDVRPNEELTEHVNKVQGNITNDRQKAEKDAIGLVLESLGIVKDQLVENPKKAKTAVSIAKDLSQIANAVSGKLIPEKERAVHVHLYAPKQAKVEDYEIIDV